VQGVCHGVPPVRQQAAEQPDRARSPQVINTTGSAWQLIADAGGFHGGYFLRCFQNLNRPFEVYGPGNSGRYMAGLPNTVKIVVQSDQLLNRVILGC